MSSSPRYLALVALAEAWPFCSPAGFEAGAIELSQCDCIRPSTPTGKLAADLEGPARVLGRGATLAAIEGIRDRAWFCSDRGDSFDRRRLGAVLEVLAARHLRWEGDAIRLVQWAPDARHERVMAWRWLSLRLPQDLLIAAVAAREGVTPCTDRVRLVGHGLEPLLREPVAETHLHMGAALDFGELWVALLEATTTATPDLGKALAKTPAPAPFGSPQAYVRALVSAGLVRQLLAAFLWDEDHRGGEGERFASFLDRRLPAIAARAGNSARASRVHGACLAALSELRTGLGGQTGQPKTSTASMVRAHHLLWGPRPRLRSIDNLIHADPLARWLVPGLGLARPETRFIARALSRSRRAGTTDAGFERALWQYLRVRNLVFGHLVESPGTAGLGWFTRHYDRLRRHRGRLDGLVVESALRMQSQDLKLGSLELRTAPKERWFEIRDEVRTLAQQGQRFQGPAGQGRPELGLVLHFIKKREEPGEYKLRCRHGRWFYEARAQSFAIARALRTDPRLLAVLRGLDIASDELAVPNWALAPLFAYLRQASRHAAAKLASARPTWRVPALRATMHAGEDFRRLVSGLRRIHETVEFKLLGEGDRIGHGLALGWSTDQWLSQHPVCVQPREERLFDLLWELERYQAGELPGQASRLVHIQGQLYTLSKKIFGRDGINDHALIALRQGLFDPSKLLGACAYPFGRVRAGQANELLLRYLCDPEVRRRALTPMEVRADEGEELMLRAAQRWLRAQLGRLAITVETNPSSNLVVGDFADLRQHPTFALSRLDGGHEFDEDQLPVSINSDDPLTFATCLADEYAYLEAALVGHGVPARGALHWLEQARCAGWRSRFTLPASAELSCLEEL